MNSSKFQKEVLDRLDEIINLLEKEEEPKIKKVVVRSTRPTTTNPISSIPIAVSPGSSYPMLSKSYKLMPDGYYYEYNSDSNKIDIVNLGNKIN